jgi:cytochrome c-type biogenesis protein CcmE
MLVSCSLGTYLILSNLNNNIVFFYPPSEVHKIKNLQNKVRIGGIVKSGSVIHDENGMIYFTLTDSSQELNVKYKGILPALFREGQGIVAEGKLVSEKMMTASKLLTKHDENYMPPGSVKSK